MIPVQLDGFENPQINTYSLESTIAEKSDAIFSRLEMTSRMKDFYDIYYLSNIFDFDGRKLQEAIFRTLQNRGTSYEKDSLNVIDNIVKFLFPVWKAIINENECFMMWNKKTAEWK